MDKKELFRALDGLFAYDTGCVDSGIHDNVLREQVREYLEEAARAETRSMYPPIIDEFLREHFYETDTLEAVLEFAGWLIELMDWPTPAYW